MNHRAILIDDDYLTRKDYYEKLLDGFEVTPVYEKAEYQKIDFNDFSLIVVDLQLWGSTAAARKIVMEQVKPSIPIILVSTHWSDSDGKTIEEFTDFIRMKNIIMCIAFKRITNASSETQEQLCATYNFDIHDRYRGFYGYETSISDDENIVILHIGDMQFGGDVSTAAYMDDQIIPRFLKEHAILPQIVCISGDVVQSGIKSEYDKAKVWLNNFVAKLLGEGYNKRRIILVPGNHDCNFSSFLTYLLKYDFTKLGFVINSKDISSEKEDKELVFSKKVDTANKSEIDETIFQQFSRFAFEMTGDIRWCTAPNHFNLAFESFANWGLLIITINSLAEINVATYDDKENSIVIHRGTAVDLDALNQLVENMSSISKGKSLFTIVISHMGPDDLKQGTSNHWKEVCNFLESIRADLWLYGHRHVLVSGCIQEVSQTAPYISGMPYLCTGSLRLKSSRLEDGAKRGFGIITLERKNGSVKRIKLATYEMNGAHPKECETESYVIEHNRKRKE